MSDEGGAKRGTEAVMRDEGRVTSEEESE